MPDPSLRRLRRIGFWEAVSFLLLLGVAMPLKYQAGRPEAVSVVGLVHGVLFIAYLVAVQDARARCGWPLRRAALLVLAALLPAGPFFTDARLRREEEAASARARTVEPVGRPDAE